MISVFEWNTERSRAAILLAEGRTQKEVAAEIEITDRTIRNWLEEPVFAEEVDRLSLMIGIASRAERLRLTQRIIRQKVREDGTIQTERDLLEWLKYAQSETDGIKLDLSKFAAALGTDDASLAHPRQIGDGATAEDCDNATYSNDGPEIKELPA